MLLGRVMYRWQKTYIPSPPQPTFRIPPEDKNELLAISTSIYFHVDHYSPFLFT